MTETATRLAVALAGRYTIERELGQGGMATVYLAQDVRHDRQVAIKVLHADLGATLGSERFLAEIRTTARLQHPHILPLLDSGDAAGLLFYVMPYVAGESLRDRLAREKQLPIDVAVLIAREVADALGAAHAHRIIHRDIKPENILLQGGHALVADFGIALAVQHAGGTRLTQTGLSLGTPQYMAPEQAMGDKAVDHRADIYALGVVLYEMLVGDPPFTGSTIQAIVAKVMTERPTPLSRVRDTVPPNVEAAVLRALAKLPADRFADAASFVQSLNDQRAWTAAAAPATRQRQPLAAWPWAMGIVIGLVTGISLANLRRAEPPADNAAPMRFLIAPDSVAVDLVCCGQMMLLSPDGRTIVFQGRPKGSAPSSEVLLYVRTADELSVRPLAGTERARSLFFSPNGDQIGFTQDRQLMRMPLRGGTPAPIARLPNGFIGGATWTTDGTILIAVTFTLFSVPASGGELQVVLQRDTTGLQVGGPSYIAESGATLFTQGTLEASPVVRFLPRGNSTAKTVMLNAATPRYVPSWRALVTVRDDGSLMAHPFNPHTGDTTGPGVRLAESVVLRSPISSYGEYAVSDNGVLLLAERESGAGSSTITVVDERGDSSRVALPIGAAVFDGARFSPDGRRLVIGAASRRSMSRSVYLWDFARSVAQRLTSDEDARRPSWDATGDTIVYRIGHGQFVARPADASGGPRTLLTLKDWAATEGHAVWGPWIAFGGEPIVGATSTDIGVAHRDSGGLVRPYANSTFYENDPVISPNGQWMAYTSGETGRPEVYVSSFPVPGARYPVSSTGGRNAAWSANGRTIFFATVSGEYRSVAFTPGTPPSFGTPRVLYERPLSRDWTISPDGKRFLFVDTARLTTLIGLELVLNAYAPPQ